MSTTTSSSIIVDFLIILNLVCSVLAVFGAARFRCLGFSSILLSKPFTHFEHICALGRCRIPLNRYHVEEAPP